MSRWRVPLLGAAGVGATLYVLIPSRFKPTQRETDISATNGRSVDSFKPRESSDGEKNILGEMETLLADLLQWSLFKVDHGVGLVKVREGSRSILEAGGGEQTVLIVIG